ncbi:FAD:protein FMN transferase [Pelagicoccus sp. SDUM812002]|uniref:FAD:protein FMN transferase n=1 Tax=Pelagicoccus sp. SDUM812002 TaxID=3041266 RepID=UPI00280F6914|nr:FAD:protein FMN transferase [Pelagicoccus sp. SDUM812002]MDQ8186516.1 FAD:protein FMN transferase [Pelagicoccus sp. SDUM812002]
MVLADRSSYRKKIESRLTFDEVRKLYRLQFQALGTACSVLFSIQDRATAIRFSESAVEWVGSFEGKYSRFLDTSLLSEINRQAGISWVRVDDEAEHLFALCDDLNFMTHGQLDPSGLPLISLWDYRRKRAELPCSAEISAAKKLVGWQKVQRRSGEVFLPEKGMCLDFGGFGKEYAVDKVAGLSMSHGICNCLVDFGQDIRVLGTPPDSPAWHIGLEDPSRPGATWTGLALLRGGGVASSGDYHRNFVHEGRRYGHIIDLSSGYPVANGLLAVTVVAQSCLEAGVLSTAAFVAGTEKGTELMEANFGAEACFVSRNSNYQTSQFYEYVVQS